MITKTGERLPNNTYLSRSLSLSLALSRSLSLSLALSLRLVLRHDISKLSYCKLSLLWVWLSSGQGAHIALHSIHQGAVRHGAPLGALREPFGVQDAVKLLPLALLFSCFQLSPALLPTTENVQETPRSSAQPCRAPRTFEGWALLWLFSG